MITKKNSLNKKNIIGGAPSSRSGSLRPRSRRLEGPSSIFIRNIFLDWLNRKDDLPNIKVNKYYNNERNERKETKKLEKVAKKAAAKKAAAKKAEAKKAEKKKTRKKASTASLENSLSNLSANGSVQDNEITTAQLKEIFSSVDSLKGQEFLNFDISGELAIGQPTPDYVYKDSVHNEIENGYLIKLKCTSKNIQSIYLFISEIKKKPTKQNDFYISYVPDIVANTLIEKNVDFTIPEFKVVVLGDVKRNMESLNIFNKDRNSKLVYKGTNINNFSGLWELLEQEPFTKINMFSCLFYCSLTYKNYLPRTYLGETIPYIDLESFAFYTLDELKELLKKELKKSIPRKNKIDLISLRLAAVCNIIVVDILKGKYFSLIDGFTNISRDFIDSKTLNSMGLFCSQIFKPEVLAPDLEIVEVSKSPSSLKVSLQPFKDSDIKIELKLVYPELDDNLKAIITQIVSGFFNNSDAVLEGIEFLSKPENVLQRNIYQGILEGIFSNIEQIMDEILSGILETIILKKEPTIQKVVRKAKISRMLPEIKSNFNYFMIMLTRICRNAIDRGMPLEHFHHKIIRLMTRRGYYSILCERIKIGYSDVYYFNALG